MTIIYWTISWLAGIWLASTRDSPTSFLFIISILATLGAIYTRQYRRWSLFLVAIAFTGLGIVRYNLANPKLAQTHIANFNGSKDIVLKGTVISEPQIRDRSINLYLDVDTLRQEDRPETNTEGEILVVAPRSSIIPYGAHLQLSGDLETPQNFSDFDYQEYLARQGVYSTMEFPQIEILEQDWGNPVIHILLRIKERGQETINRLLPGPQAALLSGILLGNDQGLSKDLQKDFQATGMTHIIAISGFNIAVIAGILLLGSRHIVGYRKASWIALAGIAVYTIFVGAEASVVRAAAMGALLILATRIMGRPTFLPAVIFTAALAMTLINPMLLWDVGFQLSFAATLGLVLYLGPWSKRIETKMQSHLSPTVAQRSTRLISDVFLATMAATIMTLPISVYHFGQISLISPLSNLLILPAQPGVMLWGGLASILGVFLPALGQIPAWIAWLFLSYTTSLVSFFASLPVTTLPLSLSFSGVLLVYTFILGITWFAGQDKDIREKLLGRTRFARLMRAAFTLFVIAAILLTFWARQRPDGKLHVVFFDVGQGDATFIQTPGGQQVLVDGGQYASKLLDGLGQKMPFWDKEIDILIVTHPDKDHFLALLGLLDHYQVRTMITNGQQGDSADYDALLEKAKEMKIPIHRALAGEIVEMDSGVRLEILHPGSELDMDQDNENSVSSRLVYRDFTLLLTGDAEVKAERKMLASGRPLLALIYKAGHHGAKTSSSALFVESVQPQYVVISAGEGNSFGHPHLEVLQRAEEIGAGILRTDQQGTIEVISDGQVLWWETEH